MSGGHGSTAALASVKNGIQIDMRSMNKVVISEDGKSATVGGGLRIKEFADILWDAGKETSKVTFCH